MKSSFLIASLIFFASFFGLSGTALADPAYDCTSGCYVVTCKGSNCTLWQCNANGCVAVSMFTKEKSAALPQQGSLIDPEKAFVKICPAKRSCQLIELDTKQAVVLGNFDNIDDIVEFRRGLDEQDLSAR